jgi:hypothetical protein
MLKKIRDFFWIRRIQKDLDEILIEECQMFTMTWVRR